VPQARSNPGFHPWWSRAQRGMKVYYESPGRRLCTRGRLHAMTHSHLAFMRGGAAPGAACPFTVTIHGFAGNSN
ncbi:MAG: hypothetical protein KHX56_10425, partial [Clostridiales bacterium]|nr:hypothetical protein [Clostridiales bacterium]